MKKFIIALVVIILIGLGIYLFSTRTADAPGDSATTTPVTTVATTTDVAEETSIGLSKEGREIPVSHYGEGEKEVLFVGGIHGGYEWNTVLLAYELMDFLEENRSEIPAGVKVSVIPVLNPDGLNKVVGTAGRFTKEDVPTPTSKTVPGRFNANNVDLNRNFDCKWKPESTWRGKTVSAGTAAFSEPETLALRDFVLAHDPVAVIFWHSQANAVYASECEAGILPETRVLMNAYARTAGYPAIDTFDSYEITGDAEGWLASIGIPSITVELSTHETTEWEKNLAGMKALFTHYSE